MLCLTFGLGERVYVGDCMIEVYAVRHTEAGPKIRLAFDAPPSVVIDREHIYFAKRFAVETAVAENDE